MPDKRFENSEILQRSEGGETRLGFSGGNVSERDRAQAQEGKMLNNASEPDTGPNTVGSHCTGRVSFATNEYLAVWAFMHVFTCTMFLKKKERKFYPHPPSLLFLSISLWPG